MAGNRRGKLKEHFEGVHRNFDWILYHCNTAMKLIEDEKHPLFKAVKALGQGVSHLDKLAQDVYSKL